MNSYLDSLAARVTRTRDPSAVRVPPALLMRPPVPMEPGPSRRRAPEPPPERDAVQPVRPTPSAPAEPTGRPGDSNNGGAAEPSGLTRRASRQPQQSQPRSADRPPRPNETEADEPPRRTPAVQLSTRTQDSPGRYAMPGRGEGPTPQADPVATAATPLTARAPMTAALREPLRVAAPGRDRVRTLADHRSDRLRPLSHEARPRTPPASQPPQPPIEIVIDRIDVRLAGAAPTPSRPSAPTPVRHLSLAHYLELRSGR